MAETQTIFIPNKSPTQYTKGYFNPNQFGSNSGVFARVVRFVVWKLGQEGLDPLPGGL